MKFIAQSFFLICVVFLGVLGGMQLADNDMAQTKAPVDYQLNGTAGAKTNENNEALTKVFEKNAGNTEKEKQLQEMKSVNTFSKIGEGIATTVERTVEIAIEPVITKMEHIISGKII